MNLTDADVQEILRLLDQSPYDELKLETERFKLTLKSSVGPGGNRIDARPATDAAMPGQKASADSAKPLPTTSQAGDIRDIRPPMPGTFYRSPSPGAEPFTEVGQAVTADSILGIVETMKLMNSVMAGCDGEVVEVCVSDGALVETDDVLVRIRVKTNG